MTTQCKTCGITIEYEPMEGFEGIKPSVCARCGITGAVSEKRKLEEVAAETKRLAWEDLCPAAYRLIEEGGITDLERLQEEHSVEWPDASREKPGLVLIGPSGLGKTRWMWRVIRNDFVAGKTITAFTARGFEAAYREADGQHHLKTFLDQCTNAGVFFLDDLGKAGWSPNTLDTFYEVLEVRGSHLRPIYITTNFTGGTLSAHLRMDTAMIEPLIRRLREYCRCISA